MISQRIEHISIKDLVLWTENPRDPIDTDASDQDVVDRAIKDKNGRWNLVKLAKEMGSHYDLSELPTVVYHDKIPVVYDGNRRIVLGKLKHKLVAIDEDLRAAIPEFPEEIPCNVCDKDTALANVYRKHADTGSWMPLERDIFQYKFMKQPKSTFLIFDESTGVITNNLYMNKRFIKDEILNEGSLSKLGFIIKGGCLYSSHTNSEAEEIIDDIIQKLKDKVISTRKNRGNLLEVLDDQTKQMLTKNRDNKHCRFMKAIDSHEDSQPSLKQSRRIKKPKQEIFGGNLYLIAGDVNDLYRDIRDFYAYFLKHQNQLSKSFSSLIRMSLRLLCETAAKNEKVELKKYVEDNFDEAKELLVMDKDTLTSMSINNISKTSITQLLHIGAHSYQAASNIEQTIALSVIIGKILTITHGKKA